jgi:phosphohistidine phosphatase
MDVFVLRHGEAVREASHDRERCLTSRGREDLQSVLSSCRTELSSVRHLLVSPYVRAQQTAEIAIEYLDPAVISKTSEFLIPEANPIHLLDYLQQAQQRDELQSVLLVSHQPLVGVLVDRLCGFDVGRYRMGTSALAFIQAEIAAASLGHLRWLRQPGNLYQS